MFETDYKIAYYQEAFVVSGYDDVGDPIYMSAKDRIRELEQRLEREYKDRDDPIEGHSGDEYKQDINDAWESGRDQGYDEAWAQLPKVVKNSRIQARKEVLSLINKHAITIFEMDFKHQTKETILKQLLHDTTQSINVLDKWDSD